MLTPVASLLATLLLTFCTVCTRVHVAGFLFLALFLAFGVPFGLPLRTLVLTFLCLSLLVFLALFWLTAGLGTAVAAIAAAGRRFAAVAAFAAVSD